jgi:hypothetical protein
MANTHEDAIRRGNAGIAWETGHRPMEPGGDFRPADVNEVERDAWQTLLG